MKPLPYQFHGTIDCDKDGFWRCTINVPTGEQTEFGSHWFRRCEGSAGSLLYALENMMREAEPFIQKAFADD